MLSREEICSELKTTLELYEKIRKVLEAAPEGNLYFQMTGKNTSPVPYLERQVNGKRTRTSLRKADPKVIKAMLFKKYAKHLVRTVENNLAALKHAERYRPLTENLKAYGGETFHACREYFFGKEAENEMFERLAERQNNYKPEHLNIKMELGSFRSREEYIVAFVLNELGLRFKYEAPLQLGAYCRYPDFTVLHPHTGKLVYLEVAGLLSDPEYRKALLRRIEEYAGEGLLLGRDLFILAPAENGGIDQAALASLLKGICGL